MQCEIIICGASKCRLKPFMFFGSFSHVWITANEDLQNDNNLDYKILDKLQNLVSCLKQQDERIKELETTAFEQRQYTQQLKK